MQHSLWHCRTSWRSRQGLRSEYPDSQVHCLPQEGSPGPVPHNLVKLVSAKPGNPEIKFKSVLIYHQHCSQNSNRRLVDLDSREAHQDTSCGPPLTHPHTRRTNDNLEKKIFPGKWVHTVLLMTFRIWEKHVLVVLARVRPHHHYSRWRKEEDC